MIRKAVIVVLTLGAVWSLWLSIPFILRTGIPGASYRALLENDYVVVLMCGHLLLPELAWAGGSLYIVLPWWMPTLALATYPTIAFVRGPLRRRRRRKRGECVSCGYNLMGNVTGVCSECGTAVR